MKATALHRGAARTLSKPCLASFSERAASLIFRFYLTTWSIVLLTDADGAVTAVAMLITGLLLDVIRWAALPEFSARKTQIAEALSFLKQDDSAVRQLRRRNMLVGSIGFGLPWLHLIIFVAADSAQGSLNVRFSKAPSFVVDLAEHVFALIRRHGIQLADAGYVGRAALLTEFYAVQYLYVVSFVIFCAFWFGARLAQSSRVRALAQGAVRTPEADNRRKAVKAVLGFTAFAMFCMAGVQFVPTLAITDSGISAWDLHVSDQALFTFCFLLTAVQLFALISYAGLYFLRVFEAHSAPHSSGGKVR